MRQYVTLIMVSPRTARAVLHIGLPKTATTALQQHFFPLLPSASVTYIGTKQPRALRPHPVFTAVLNAINSTPNAFEEQLRLAQSALASVAVERLVLLSEEMITVDGPLRWQQKVARLGKVFSFHECTVLLTIREPVRALFSLYAELFRSVEKSFPTIMDFAESNQAAIYDYRCLIAVVQDAFPDASITIAPFEQLKPGGSFLDIVASALKLESPVRTIPMENNSKQRIGGGIRLQPLTIQSALERFCSLPTACVMSGFLQALFAKLAPMLGLLRAIPLPWTSRWLPMPGENDTLLRYAKSNNWLLEGYGIDYTK